MHNNIYVCTKFISRCSSTSSVELVGRKILKPGQLTTHEIKSILWTAFEIKALTTKCVQNIKCMNHIAGANVTMLMSQSNVKLQSIVNDAAHLMDVNLNIIIDDKWEHEKHAEDIGKLLSSNTELILCQSKGQMKMQQMAESINNKPVMNIHSCRFNIPRTLADLMALTIRYGYLKDLNIAWVGLPCPLFNTYLCIVPRMGINIRYIAACCEVDSVSPMSLPIGTALSKYMKTKLQEYTNLKDILKVSNVIATSRHPNQDVKITMENLRETTSSRWTLIHCLPRGNEVDDEVFNHKNNIVWLCLDSMKWVYCALMLRLLRKYHHVTPEPPYDSDRQNISGPHVE